AGAQRLGEGGAGLATVAAHHDALPALAADHGAQPLPQKLHHLLGQVLIDQTADVVLAENVRVHLLVSPHSNLLRPLSSSAFTTARTSWLRSFGTTSTASPASTTTMSVSPTRPSGRPDPTTTQPAESTSSAPRPRTTFPCPSAERTSGRAAKLPTSDHPKSPGTTAMSRAFSITP